MSRGIKEVIWEGKYDADGRSQCPSIESLLECKAEPFQRLTTNSNPKGCGLFHADNLEVMAQLERHLKETGEALIGDDQRVKLIYIDPPFDIDREMLGKFKLGEGKDSKPYEPVCYDDRWGDDKESFAFFMWERLIAMRHILHEEGSIFVHTNDHSAPLLRALLDDVFGAERFVNQIIWHYTGGGRARSRFSNKHDVILWYSKSEDFTFNADEIRVPYKETSGYAKGGIKAASGKHYKPNPKGTLPSDVWEIPIVNPMAKERTGYPTQKPLELMERILLVASSCGDTVADFFCGSGSFLEAAGKHERCVIGADASPIAFATSLSRIGACAMNYSTWYLPPTDPPGGALFIEGKQEEEGFVVESIEGENMDEEGSQIRLISLNEKGSDQQVWGARDLRVGDKIPLQVSYDCEERDYGMFNVINYRGELYRGESATHSRMISMRRWL